MSEKVAYVGRTLYLDNLLDPNLVSFIFDVSRNALCRAGISRTAQEDWQYAISSGRLPRVDRHGKEVCAETNWRGWGEFEQYLACIVREIAENVHLARSQSFTPHKQLLEQILAQRVSPDYSEV